MEAQRFLSRTLYAGSSNRNTTSPVSSKVSSLAASAPMEHLNHSSKHTEFASAALVEEFGLHGDQLDESEDSLQQQLSMQPMQPQQPMQSMQQQESVLVWPAREPEGTWEVYSRCNLRDWGGSGV